MLSPDMDMYAEYRETPLLTISLVTASVGYTVGYSVGNAAFGSMTGSIGTGIVYAALTGGSTVVGIIVASSVMNPREHMD